jgi:hypothetical protein
LVVFGDVAVVACAFRVDATRAVLFPGSAAHRHHGAAITLELQR